MPSSAHSCTSQDEKYTPILVTGAHRTGTTWVGRMLAASQRVTYISEPLNVWHRPGVNRAPTKYWYTYICPQNQSEYLPALRETIDLRYHLAAEIQSLRSIKDTLRMGRDWSNFLLGRIFKKRALLKDPFAAFSAPWFADTLGCQVAITIRHPAAFASSLKRLNWTFDFNNLLSQSLLMRDWLDTFREDMEKALHSQDIIQQASLLWRMIYQVVTAYQKERPQFQLVRHEDLSIDPLGGFRTLYANLELPFTPRVQKMILKASRPENPKELSGRAVHAVHLDSLANLHNWKHRLDGEEIQQIRRLTGDVAAHYYPNRDWE